MSVGKIWLGPVAAVVLGFLAACASSSSDMSTANLGTTLAPPDARYLAVVDEYRISPYDRLSINVFPVKDFSIPSTRVDAGGSVLVPPLGAITAQGKTARELSAELESKLAACCLQKPQVVVMVEETTTQQITVVGAVVASDVYNLRGRTTLLQAITMAKGPDRATANLKSVAIMRMVNGQRTGAKFDVEAIRAGKAEDPQVFGGDTIIVDASRGKSIWRNTVQVIPFFGIFAAF